MDVMNDAPFSAGPAPVPPRRGASLFDSIRRSGWYRPRTRFLGGVCASVSARTGWDPALVRGLAVILGVFMPPTWIAYGLGWALLPEEEDGRIHAEELVHGRFDIAQAGAILMMLIGAGVVFPWGLSFTTGSLGLIGVSFFGVVIVAGLVTLLVATATMHGRGSPHPRTTSPQSPNPWSTAPDPQKGAPMSTPPTPGGPQTPPAASTNGPVFPGMGPSAQSGAYPRSASWQAPAAAQSHAPGSPSPTPVWQTPPRPWMRPRKVAGWINLGITGLVTLIIALTCFFMYEVGRRHSILPTSALNAPSDLLQIRAMLIGGGICLAIVGLAIVIASFRDRAAGWLSALALFGVFLSFPVLIANAAWNSQQEISSSVGSAFTSLPSVGNMTADWTADSNLAPGSSVGDLTLDLREAPADLSKTFVLNEVVGTLTVNVRPDQPVRLVADGFVGSVSTDGDTLGLDYDSGFGGSIDMSSPGFSSKRGIELRIDSMIGDVVFVEDPEAKTPAEEPATQDGAQSAAAASASATPERAITAQRTRWVIRPDLTAAW